MLSSPCPICGYDCSVAASSCPECNHPLQTNTSQKAAETDPVEQSSTDSNTKLMSCPDCGHACSKSAIACPNCGKPFQTTTHRDYSTPGKGNVWLTRKTLTLGVVAALLLLAASAVFLYTWFRKQEGVLTGEVFIVTQGAQNFKLGLVEVTAIPEDKMGPFILKKEDAVRVATDKFKTEQKANQKELDAVQQEYDALTQAADLAEVKVTEAEQRYELTHPYTYDLDYTSWSEAKQRATQRTRDEFIKLKSQATSKQSELGSIQATMRNSVAELEKKVSEDSLFADVPNSDMKATTDAEGRFSMKVPAKGRFAIAARAQRSVVGSTEHYYWLIWVSLDGEKSKQVMLSNNNLMSAESKDSVFNLKELIKNNSSQEISRWLTTHPSQFGFMVRLADFSTR